MPIAQLPKTLEELRTSGWQSRSVKDEVRGNFLRLLAECAELFPGIVGYDDTVVPEINIALLAGHDMLFLGEKGQAKSRLMRQLVRFLDEQLPYLDDPAIPFHDDPYRPISRAGKRLVAERAAADVPIAWWPREERYAERLAPGTKFADIIGEIDPARLMSGTSMSAEDALHFGLIPRQHRGIDAEFAAVDRHEAPVENAVFAPLQHQPGNAQLVHGELVERHARTDGQPCALEQPHAA